MKKILTIVAVLGIIVLAAKAKDILIELQSGAQERYSLDDIKDITFESDDEEDGLFKINTKVTGPYSVEVTITPQGYTGNYLFLVVKKSVLDGYISVGNIDGWIEGDLDWLKEMAESYGMTLDKFLQSYRQA